MRDEGRNPVNEGRGATRARKEGKEVIKRGGKGERERTERVGEGSKSVFHDSRCLEHF